MPKPRSRRPAAVRLAAAGALAAMLAAGCSRVDAPARPQALGGAVPSHRLAAAAAAHVPTPPRAPAPLAGDTETWMPAPALAMADLMALRIDPAAGVLLAFADAAGTTSGPLPGADAWGALTDAAAALQRDSDTLSEPGWALDRRTWLRAVAELREGGRDGERAARLRDPPRLAAAGERVRQACMDCHERYAPRVR